MSAERKATGVCFTSTRGDETMKRYGETRDGGLKNKHPAGLSEGDRRDGRGKRTNT